ncbi:Vacuolar membrane protein [Drechslerella dactyloides]|uniref:Peptide hydrolase n=1 Tax=Drechslerella dactyloides TaxID=74499 RepID=A0AAD6IUN2_DREDA|nr:Vacuolar membrane protein [Drechslerella dactyloides]
MRLSLKTPRARLAAVMASSSCGPCKLSFAHFRPLPVTILTVVIYLALFIPLLIIHYVPPSPPPNDSLKSAIGVDLEETWRSLAAITRRYHPYNSHANDDVRSYLVQRIQDIIARNGDNATEVVVDNDVNVLYQTRAISIYFESMNIIVKVPGTGHFEGEVGDVLVNAHYDSVSTAPGATDDGVAVVTVLGLIDYFTQPAHAPRRSVFFLFNNGEEDYLNGAVAFTEHPLAKTCRLFLNLEGAGAGGRATLFRSTDAEVTKFFRRAKYPFGSSLSGDAFKRGFIRSQTDYIIFDGHLDMRGLDLAFWQPRDRYHTQWDSMAFTSRDSLWHMFETSLASVEGMASDGSYTFIPGSGRKHTGVWFDMFGRGFAVFQIKDTFIASMCLLTIAPFFILLTVYFLAKSDKLYLFASSPSSNTPLPAKLELAGFKGFWRPIIAIILAGAAVVGVALLIAKVNPMIMYSSQEAVWVCLMSLWIIVTWVILRAANWWRPTATARTWGIVWLSSIAWLLLAACATAQDRLDVGGLYFTIFYYIATALALFLALLDFFVLPPTAHIYNAILHTSVDLDDDDRRSLIAPSVDERPDDDEPTEHTSLLRDASNLGRGRHIGRRPNSHGSLSIGASSTLPTLEANEDDEPDCAASVHCAQRQYFHEQHWSRGLPRYTWLPQVLLLIPIPVILTAQVALIVGTSIAQTGADGNPVATAYILYAFFTVLLLLPLLPFTHRWTHHVPVFLTAVFTATLLYLLLAFPFSWDNPLKVYFSQSVDLHSGANTVHLIGVRQYLRGVVTENLPSAWTTDVNCTDDTARLGLYRCSWTGLAPNVAPGVSSPRKWAAVNATLIANATDSSSARHVRLHITPRNSRACRLLFDRKVAGVTITDPTGVGKTTPHGDIAEGVDHLRLWSREWERGWIVDAFETENVKKALTGRVECLWSDANNAESEIPALDEVKRFLPRWAVVSKLEDGLVVGEKRWSA